MYKEYAQKLKKARIDKSYTQKDVELELSIKQTQLSKIENNQIEPNIETLCKLIDFYEVSADWVLGTGKKR